MYVCMYTCMHVYDCFLERSYETIFVGNCKPFAYLRGSQPPCSIQGVIAPFDRSLFVSAKMPTILVGEIHFGSQGAKCKHTFQPFTTQLSVNTFDHPEMQTNISNYQRGLHLCLATFYVKNNYVSLRKETTSDM